MQTFWLLYSRPYLQIHLFSNWEYNWSEGQTEEAFTVFEESITIKVNSERGTQTDEILTKPTLQRHLVPMLTLFGVAEQIFVIVKGLETVIGIVGGWIVIVFYDYKVGSTDN